MSRVDFTGLDRISHRITAIQAGLRPGSRLVGKALRDIRQAAIDDHHQKMLRGLDRKERPLTKLAASTLKKRRRPPGGPLMPGGQRSSFYDGITAVWDNVGGVWRFTMSFVKPYAKYHLTGCPKGSKPSQPNWSLPQRDVGGLTLKGRDAIRAIAKEYLQRVARGGEN